MFRLRSIILAVLVTIGFVQSGGAQTVLFDSGRLQFSCARGNCENAVRATVNQLIQADLSEPEFNTQLGVIAAILFETSRDADAEIVGQISLALRLLAQFTSDFDQRDSLIRVAQVILDGGRDLFNLADPFAVSPS